MPHWSVSELSQWCQREAARWFHLIIKPQCDITTKSPRYFMLTPHPCDIIGTSISPYISLIVTSLWRGTAPRYEASLTPHRDCNASLWRLTVTVTSVWHHCDITMKPHAMLLPSGSSTVLARRRDRVSRLSCTLSCSIARSIICERPPGRSSGTAPRRRV